ncbi:NAD(P)/FAD-dependent oxidoreductase [Alloyangia pacifica]|uniref:Sarcosine oxidase subunit beta n=1 Tax=Alloyangia pacifica TaxID=311180 RepID=A0A1I6UZ40_9RHOB|nr:FAD-binding oxidoreductase [Alloyangia pacifica]SDI31449.1 sarcosine oxidase subunit beta [Alloyangia pacifica]SFT06682.1 sarcosine oxidase subunit beta [Alloyangia pacifica]
MPARFLHSLSDVPDHPDVTIVGGGIAGLATAWALSQRGLRPLLIERLPALAMLASRRSGEGVRAQWEHRGSIALARPSIEFYRDFATHTGQDAGYRPVGYLYASRSAAGAELLRDRVRRQQAAGLDDVAFLQPDALRAQVPSLAEDVVGGAFRAADGVVEIDRIIAGYLASMEADILLGCDLLVVRPGNQSVTLRTTLGEIHTGQIVLATAARLPGLMVGLNQSLPLRLSRSAIQYVTLDGIDPQHPATIDADLGSFWRPDHGGARMTASFRSTLFLDSFTDDPPVDPDYLAQAIATVAPLVPFWGHRSHEIRGGHIRSGSLLVTGDGLPLIGALPETPRVILNTGYGGHGVMMSPAGAARTAGIVLGDAPDPHTDPARFADPDNPPPAEPMTVNLAG